MTVPKKTRISLLTGLGRVQADGFRVGVRFESSKDHVKAEREKLLRLHLNEATGQWNAKEVDGFKDKLTAAFPHFPEIVASPQIPTTVGGVAGTFNLEGLALLPGGKLLFGFRSPTHPAMRLTPLIRGMPWW